MKPIICCLLYIKLNHSTPLAIYLNLFIKFLGAEKFYYSIILIIFPIRRNIKYKSTVMLNDLYLIMLNFTVFHIISIVVSLNMIYNILLVSHNSIAIFPLESSPFIDTNSSNKPYIPRIIEEQDTIKNYSNFEKISILPKYKIIEPQKYYSTTVYINTSNTILSQIKNVTYLFHPTFNPDKVTLNQSKHKFAYSFTASGAFPLTADVQFINGSKETITTTITPGIEYFFPNIPKDIKILQNILKTEPSIDIDTKTNTVLKLDEMSSEFTEEQMPLSIRGKLSYLNRTGIDNVKMKIEIKNTDNGGSSQKFTSDPTNIYGDFEEDIDLKLPIGKYNLSVMPIDRNYDLLASRYINILPAPLSVNDLITIIGGIIAIGAGIIGGIIKIPTYIIDRKQNKNLYNYLRIINDLENNYMDKEKFFPLLKERQLEILEEFKKGGITLEQYLILDNKISELEKFDNNKNP